MSGLIVSGTDTGIGKTVVAAMLARALDGIYFKPIQAGNGTDTDTETVRRLTGFGDDRLVPETYRLETPASPHIAAEIDGIEIDVTKLVLPDTARPLIVEGAGGLLVPITRRVLQIDVMMTWKLPVVLCARTMLGTINHTLLSVEALRARAMDLLGIIFVGSENRDTERTIADFAAAKQLGRMPVLEHLTPEALDEVFAQRFDRRDFKI